MVAPFHLGSLEQAAAGGNVPPVHAMPNSLNHRLDWKIVD